MSLSVYFVGTLLSVGLATPQNLGTGLSYLGSSSHEQTASRLALAQQGLLGTSTSVDSVDLNVSKVKDGMLVFIYNVDYRFTRLDMQWHIYNNQNACFVTSGDVNVSQLWKLEEDPTRKGEFFIVNWAFSKDGTSWRYTGLATWEPNQMPSFMCIDGAKRDDQLWKFYKQWDGYWHIENAASSDKLGCWANGGGCNACSGVDQQYAKECISHTSFRLQPAFTSSALWFIADSVDNNTDYTVKRTVTFSEGITETIEHTVAKSASVEMSLSIGMEGPLEEIGLSMQETLTVQNSFSESYARTLTKTWSVERKVEIPLPPHTRICLKQLKVNNVDNTNGIGFGFKSSLYKLEQNDACN